MAKPFVLHERTDRLMSRYLHQPAHALLIIGSDGIGKGSIARHLVANVLHVPPEGLATYPYITIVEPDGSSISVDTIRGVQKLMQLKTPGTALLRRAIIIEHAQSMTSEAQNAFLKLLEEPPADTIIILTADNKRSVLPTILSRSQVLQVTAPGKAALQEYFGNYDSKQVDQAYFMSGGLPGLMHAVLEENDNHPLLTSVQYAKRILSSTTFERLTMIEPIAKQREDSAQITQALRHIAEATLLHASASNTHAKVKQWHKILKLSVAANEQLSQSANTKLVLTNLMLQL